jgi:hypothetical protein
VALTPYDCGGQARGIKLILALAEGLAGLEKYIEWSQDAESAPSLHSFN